MTPVEATKVLTALSFAVRLIYDIALEFNADLTAHPERIAILAPPASHTAFNAMLDYVRLQKMNVASAGDGFLPEVHRSVGLIARRWSIGCKNCQAPVFVALLMEGMRLDEERKAQREMEREREEREVVGGGGRGEREAAGGCAVRDGAQGGEAVQRGESGAAGRRERLAAQKWLGIELKV